MSPPSDEPDVSGIEGANQIVAVFGRWPMFHDAEVLWITLDRSGDGDSVEPTLDATVHAFEGTDQVDKDGYYVSRHHVRVHFRFRGIEELELGGFNCQNVLFQIEIQNLHELQTELIQFGVYFRASYGVFATFHCRAIEVVSVEPCDQEGSLVH